MDKAKAAITDFMSKSGHHDTTVHEAVAPAVQHEVVKPHVHEEVQTAVDKEVHQDHYHRTVQPVQDREVLPEQHTAKLGAVQHREFDHRDHDNTKRNLIEEQARFKDERRVDATTHSQSAAAAIGGEHVHHHIHETIQPVVQKETIQPNVVHTTVPIHEVHHNKATHHSTTALPPMTMDEFKNKGGALTGREERYDAFEGVPKNISAGTAGGFGVIREGEGHHDHHHVSGTPRHGDYDGTARHGGESGVIAGAAAGAAGHHGQQHTDFARDNRTHTAKDGLPDALREDRSRADAHNTHTRDSVSSSEHGEHKKPSLMDKLNPKVDADGDGKRGFMK
ncbi:uncharacterized protein EKO05_0001679 [Ascochyta rabiei]|uniref:Uncharacterized protein n=1 Tax=Didymella rabiei TaxID=5454 RepID=A0A163BEG9_DIDRA|nr:uncharacterized protein EKO05_0001679 [Ascochyta rabiei]KZM21729.1 hypothetical protein ST47_g7078 [Ascochyta rabiei]UPX11055.1 hypothetical protein EKO05_0001679 [Ascochyta rabiei]